MANIIKHPKLQKLNKIMTESFDSIEILERENIHLKDIIAQNETKIKNLETFNHDHGWLSLSIDDSEIDQALKDAKDLGL